MMKIEFRTGNDAFRDADGNEDVLSERLECARILRAIEASLGMGENRGFITDANGNRIGEWSVS